MTAGYSPAATTYQKSGRCVGIDPGRNQSGGRPGAVADRHRRVSSCSLEVLATMAVAAALEVPL